MRKQSLVCALALIAACLTLTACGGGGGDDNGSNNGGSTPLPDLSSSSVKIASGTAPPGGMQIVLDDAGNVLAVWASAGIHRWARGTAASTWTNQSDLPPSASVGRPLRGSVDGQAVLQGGFQEVSRFDGSNWIVASTGLNGYSIYGNETDALLPDGGLPALHYSSDTLRLMTQRGTSEWISQAEFLVGPRLPVTMLAGSRGGLTASSARVITGVPDTADPDSMLRFRITTVDLESSVVSPSVLTSAIARQGCAGSAVTSDRVTIISSPVQRASGGTGCDVRLVRFDHQTSVDQVDTMGTSGFYLKSTPLLLMDERGNALVIWNEEQTIFTGQRTRWSQSLEGGAWSAPQSLPVPAGYNYANDSLLAVSMNAAGQVAAASVAMRQNDFGPAIVARFSFTAGWSSWSAISAAPTQAADVAINSRGDAIAIYRLGSDLYTIRF